MIENKGADEMSEASKAKRKPAAAKGNAGEPAKANTVVLAQGPDDDPGEVIARAMLGQNLRHGHVAAIFSGHMMSGSGDTLALMDCAKIVQQRATDAIGGDLSFASAMLASQAITLDAMFTELARRAALNMSEYLGATDSYGRLALKAQSNCRATLEALAKLHQPREQTVRHVHVNEGGQAVIADEFHHHAGGSGENGKSNEQSHGAATGSTGSGPALPGPDPFGSGVPIPSRKRETAMQAARGD